MIFKCSLGDPHTIVKYARAITPLLGDITEFEVFRDYEQTPFKDGEEERFGYSFILKDDKENEVWLKTLCGYSGSGPNATVEILKILGLHEDYGITKQGENHIHKKNLKPSHHRLNLLVTQSTEYPELSKKPLFWTMIDFQDAYSQLLIKDFLNSIGYLYSAKNQGIKIPPELKKYELVNEWANHAINNEFILSANLVGFTETNIKNLFETFAVRKNCSIEFMSI